ncbi:MAG: hypothetical protein ACYC21_08055 [Eubacteriales bacterium]
MNWKKVFPICLMILFYIVGCGPNNVTQSKPSSKITPKADATKIPIIAFIENSEKGQTKSSKAVLYQIDLSSGKVRVDKNALFERNANGPFDFRIVWDGEKNLLVKATPFRGSSIKLESLNTAYNIRKLDQIQRGSPLVIKNSGNLTTVYNEKNKIIVQFENGNKQEVTLPVSYKEKTPYPLLIFGDERKYQLLGTFDQPSVETKGLIVGKLLLATVIDGSVSWKEVTGEYCSFIAGAGSSVAKYGDQIFITACGNVKVLDIRKNKLVLEDYKPINDLLTTVKDRFTVAPIDPIFGVYRDYLLVTAGISNENWLWVLKNGVCVGWIDIDKQSNRIETHFGNQTSAEVLPGKPTYDLPQLPVNLYGSWK